MRDHERHITAISDSLLEGFHSRFKAAIEQNKLTEDEVRQLGYELILSVTASTSEICIRMGIEKRRIERDNHGPDRENQS